MFCSIVEQQAALRCSGFQQQAAESDAGNAELPAILASREFSTSINRSASGRRQSREAVVCCSQLQQVALSRQFSAAGSHLLIWIEGSSH